MRRGIIGSGAIGLSLLVAAPAEFPDWAKGRTRILADPSQMDRTDLIHYRALAREDFRGQVPPPGVRAIADRLVAATCAYIKTADDVQILAKSVVVDGRVRSYEGDVVNLRFETVMNRACSWWNVKNKSLPATYVLQHEQIHFAIFELAVRHLNDRIPQLAAAARAEGAAPREALNTVLGRIKERLVRGSQEAMARSNQFDEDTSLGYRPERQEEWFRRVQAELDPTASSRSGSESAEGASSRGLPSSLAPR